MKEKRLRGNAITGRSKSRNVDNERFADEIRGHLSRGKHDLL